MLKNYLKIAFRNFIRNKSSSFINVAGLSLGLAGCLLILLWIFDEISINRFHDDIDRIYQVMGNQHYAQDQIFTMAATPGLLAPALVDEIPEIEYSASYTWNITYLFTKNEISTKERGIYSRPDIFNILTFQVLEGNPERWLTEPNTVVISDELAQKYFGTEPVAGQSILVDGDRLYSVVGVFESIPKNSTMRFDYILPFQDFEQRNPWVEFWGNNGPRTIAKLRPGSDPAIVNNKIRNFIKEKFDGSVVELFLHPFGDLYLYGRFEDGKVAGGRIEYVRLFSVIALFVLLIGCINFMNLSTAQFAKRAREVGIRKSIGANRSSLIGQYLGESVIVAFCSLIVSLILIELFLPVFNNLTQKDIVINYTEPKLLLVFAAIALVTGLFAGSYPALYLSSFEAVKTLKGTIKSGLGEIFVRKGLVIFQFTLSIVLIISTIIVYQQIQYAQTKNLGYQKENLIFFPIEGDLSESWETFSHNVSSIPAVTGVSRANHTFLGRSTNTSGVDWPGRDPSDIVLFEIVRVDYDLVETMGFELSQGRAFSRDFGAGSTGLLVNETAASIMELENPVGQNINLFGEERQIIGILKDFHYDHLRSKVEPLVMTLNHELSRYGYIRLETDDVRSTLYQIETVHNELNPSYPFDYSFVDERYAALYRSEMLTGELSKYFAVFAIIISCLGLFGLSSFTAERRRKEFSIRKVLGASVAGIVGLHCREFVKLVVIAIIISTPIAYYIMNQWLQDYAYRININLWIFVVSGGLALFIALLTVSYRAIRAAVANPVEALRYE